MNVGSSDCSACAELREPVEPPEDGHPPRHWRLAAPLPLPPLLCGCGPGGGLRLIRWVVWGGLPPLLPLLSGGGGGDQSGGGSHRGGSGGEGAAGGGGEAAEAAAADTTAASGAAAAGGGGSDGGRGSGGGGGGDDAAVPAAVDQHPDLRDLQILHLHAMPVLDLHAHRDPHGPSLGRSGAGAGDGGRPVARGPLDPTALLLAHRDGHVLRRRMYIV